MPSERVEAIMEEIRGPAGRTMWDKLGNVSEEVLANYLKNEYPQTVAVILSKIRPDHAARVLELLPEEFAMEVVMRMLRMGGIVESVRGADGGYRLAHPAESVDLWSALQALGGAFFDRDFCACHPGRNRTCVRTTDCSLRALWGALQTGLRAALEGISLADLQRDERSMWIWMDEQGAGDVGKHFAGL